MRPKEHFSSASTRGFSTPEWMVPTIIGALLVGMLLPALGKARETARGLAYLAKLDPSQEKFTCRKSALSPNFIFSQSGAFYQKDRRYDLAARVCNGWDLNLFGFGEEALENLTDAEWTAIATDARAALQKALKDDDSPKWLQNNLTVVENFLAAPAPAAETATPAPAGPQ